MQISTVGTNSSYSTTTSDSTIKDLEKQKADIQKEITETNSSNENSETKQKKVEQFQQQLQQIEMQIQQVKMKNKTEQTKEKEAPVMKQGQVEISKEANTLYEKLLVKEELSKLD